MEHHVYPSEFALLLVWLTAPAQAAMLLVLSVWNINRGGFGRAFRFRSVVVLIAAYLLAAVLTAPIWLMLPHVMLPPQVLPDTWPSLPPLAFAPAWISCFAVGLGTWFVMRTWLSVSLPNQ
jgi:hypothetical protein